MERLAVRTERTTQLIEITRLVEESVAGAEGAAVLVSVPHTTAGVTINENADPDVARDIETALERLVEEDRGWRHIEDGQPDAASHIRTAVVGNQVVVPLEAGGARARPGGGVLPRRG